MNTAYAKADCCGADCYRLGKKTDEPCWGRVIVIEEEETAVSGWQWVHACRGHEETYQGGAYLPMPEGGRVGTA